MIGDDFWGQEESIGRSMSNTRMWDAETRELIFWRVQNIDQRETITRMLLALESKRPRAGSACLLWMFSTSSRNY